MVDNGNLTRNSTILLFLTDLLILVQNNEIFKQRRIETNTRLLLFYFDPF